MESNESVMLRDLSQIQHLTVWPRVYWFQFHIPRDWQVAVMG